LSLSTQESGLSDKKEEKKENKSRKLKAAEEAFE